MYKDYIMRL